jgi:hypothetical protein
VAVRQKVIMLSPRSSVYTEECRLGGIVHKSNDVRMFMHSHRLFPTGRLHKCNVMGRAYCFIRGQQKCTESFRWCTEAILVRDVARGGARPGLLDDEMVVRLSEQLPPLSRGACPLSFEWQ